MHQSLISFLAAAICFDTTIRARTILLLFTAKPIQLYHQNFTEVSAGLSFYISTHTHLTSCFQSSLASNLSVSTKFIHDTSYSY